jgi:DNA/RNA-binding domain of Phe-tRNA-synthetase-like protein
VDCCNWCSLRFLLPIGLYDTKKIDGSVLWVRRGSEGEGYKGLGKDRVNLGGHLLLADDQGPFGHPSADSERTCIDLETRSLLWIIFAPRSYPSARLADHLHSSIESVTAFCGGSPKVLDTGAPPVR